MRVEAGKRFAQIAPEDVGVIKLRKVPLPDDYRRKLGEDEIEWSGTYARDVLGWVTYE